MSRLRAAYHTPLSLWFFFYLVNYRGSTGFGEDSINSLVGHIGEHDVSDVQVCLLNLIIDLYFTYIDRWRLSNWVFYLTLWLQKAADEILELYGLDKNRVVALGGSHGGFLVAHMIGQYPVS